MTNLYLIRHGEMEPMQDVVGDAGLSALGKIQAERLRDRLAATGEIKADILITSTFPRARQTAEIIAPALHLTPILDDDLQEQRPGEVIGLPRAEARSRYPEVDYEETPFRALAPGAENWGQFMLRVGTTLNRITTEYEGKTIVLVCHGGVIDGSFFYFFHMSTLSVPPVRMHIFNTSITHWRRFTPEGKNPRWHLVKHNDTLHLHDIDTPARIPWAGLSARPAAKED